MKIYTKQGDGGESSLFGGDRVPKDHDRLEAYGTLDELNSCLGLARAEAARDPELDPTWSKELDQLLNSIQNHLFDLGSELATPDPQRLGLTLVSDRDVVAFEAAIDQHESGLTPLKQFILPGGSALASQLHVARCVCRRAERMVVGLARHESVREEAVRYLNRLSDLLFVLARYANHSSGREDAPWQKSDGTTDPATSD